jgi:Ulp1 family protease
MNDKRIHIYDSLGGTHKKKLKLLMNYLTKEHMDKKEVSMDCSTWKRESPSGIPHQNNNDDCGIFACAFAERLARRSEFDFGQEDMNGLRKRMAHNIESRSL